MQKTYEYICKNSEIPFIVMEAEKQKYIGLDTENSGGLDVLNENFKLLLLQLSIGNKAYVIDARKVDLTLLRAIIEDTRWVKIVQHAKYDFKTLRVVVGLSLRNIFDTRIAEAIIQAGMARNGNSLGDLALKYLNVKLEKEIVNTFTNHPYSAPFTDKQLEYAANDVLVLPEIRYQQQMYLNQYRLNAVAETEFRVIEPVAEMELAGFRLDADMWRKSLAQTSKHLFQIGAELRQVLPDPLAPPPKAPRLRKNGTLIVSKSEPKPPPVLNLDSWQQLVEAFGKIGVDLEKANKKTQKGLTNSATLKFAQSMYSSEPIKVKTLKNLIKYRELNQVQKTFGENLIDHISKDGKIHAEFNQDGTVAGRFSSSSPNLENIQKKGIEGRILRSCFIPADNHKFIIADYSQLHLRIAAELSQDPVMLGIFARGEDLHVGTASQMFGVPIKQITKDMRKSAKTINFGIIYGMGVKSLADRLEVPMDVARDLWSKYREKFSVLMDYLDNAGKTALDKGYARTIGGRIRWFPSLNEKANDYKMKRAYFERVGKNHPILGTDGDMLKLSMVLLYNPLLAINSKIVNCIHDELVVEAPCEHAVNAAKIVKREMIYAGKKFLKTVPVLVEVKIRDCWWKEDIDATKLGIQDDEEGQQLWLMPQEFDFGN